MIVTGAVTIGGLVLHPTATVAAAVGRKQPVRGLVDRQGKPGLLGVPLPIVVNLPWSALEPSPGTFTLAPYTQAADAAKTAGCPGAILRISAGPSCPADLLSLSLVDPTVSGGSFRAPKWWTTAYRDRAIAFETWLAGRLDPDPWLREFTGLWAAGSHYSGEWTIRQLADQTNVQTLTAAGYTTAADRSVIEAILAAEATLWPTTRLQFWQSGNGMQTLSAAGKVTQDGAYAATLRATMRALSPDCAIGVDGSRFENGGTSYSAPEDYYQQIAAQGGLRHEQTATLARIFAATGGQPSRDGLLRLIADATAVGTVAIELPSGYQSYLTTADAHTPMA